MPSVHTQRMELLFAVKKTGSEQTRIHTHRCKWKWRRPTGREVSLCSCCFASVCVVPSIDLKNMAVCFRRGGVDSDDNGLESKRLRESFAELLVDEESDSESRPLGHLPEWEWEGLLDRGQVPGELLVSSLLAQAIQTIREPRL